MKKFFLMLTMSAMGAFAHADSLSGLELTYELNNGQIYNIEFGEGELSYRFLSGKKPEKLWGAYSYKASKTGSGENFVAWHEDGYYATILFNTETKEVHSSSISGKRTWFLQGKITEVKN